MISNELTESSSDLTEEQYKKQYRKRHGQEPEMTQKQRKEIEEDTSMMMRILASLESASGLSKDESNCDCPACQLKAAKLDHHPDDPRKKLAGVLEKFSDGLMMCVPASWSHEKILGWSQQVAIMIDGSKARDYCYKILGPETIKDFPPASYRMPCNSKGPDGEEYVHVGVWFGPPEDWEADRYAK